MNYGASGGIDDALSRVASLVDNDGLTHLADYTRIGANTFVEQSSPQPQIAWSLINGTGVDPYSGLDQFDRVADNRWYSTATSGDLDRMRHGYDRAGNPLWRKNTVAEAAGVYLDELYGYDGINRLAELQRGQLNTSNSGIVAGTLNFGQAWGNDATGNWAHYWQNDTGSSWNLQQMRTASKANEITGIVGGGWAQPDYDAAGNVVQMPQSAAPSIASTATYDAWNRMMDISSGGSPISQNAYDGENRRVTKLASGTLRHYFSSSSQSLEERLGVNSTSDRQFVFGLRFAGDLVLRDRGAERFYALQDANTAVSAICSDVGTVAERYLYAAYGAPRFLTPSFSTETGSAYDWETLFEDFRFDSQSDLYLAFESHLSPVMGFWLTRGDGEDAFGFDGVNLYEFHDGGPPKRNLPSQPTAAKRPKSKPPRKQPAKPARLCKMEICCAKLIVNGVVATCPDGTSVPCHCFIRVSEPKHKPREYHGVSVFVLNSNCPGCLALKCEKDLNQSPLPTVLGTEGCVTLGFYDCSELLDCLSRQRQKCNNLGRCYNALCGPPNSNTVAFEYTEACSRIIPEEIPTIKLPTDGTGCTSNPVAPGWR